MPRAPYALPQVAALAQVEPTFLAMAAAEFVTEARQSQGTAKAPIKGEADAPTVPR